MNDNIFCVALDWKIGRNNPPRRQLEICRIVACVIRGKIVLPVHLGSASTGWPPVSRAFPFWNERIFRFAASGPAQIADARGAAGCCSNLWINGHRLDVGGEMGAHARLCAERLGSDWQLSRGGMRKAKDDGGEGARWALSGSEIASESEILSGFRKNGWRPSRTCRFLAEIPSAFVHFFVHFARPHSPF